ncbi:hypothetical protein ACET3Z_030951 [Daucus carota]
MARIAVLLLMVLAVAAAEAAFICNGPLNQQASAKCVTYTRTGADKEPSAECCKAYKAHVESAKTVAERRALCACVQNNDGTNPGNNITKVDSLQGKCGLPFLFSAARGFDCNTVM